MTLSVADALARTLRLAPELPAEHVPLAEAHGRVLREAVRADRPQPPFDRAAMDGFAVRAADVAGPCALPVAFELRAGQWPQQALAAGSAARIMTGAPLPAGADAVVPVERTRMQADGRVAFELAATPGQHVAPLGSEVAAGELLLAAGCRLDAGALGVLASVGIAQPRVGRRPRLAVLVTGDEIVPVDEVPGPARIRNSNGPAVAALAAEAGALVRDHGIVADEAAALEAALARALSESDVVVTSGGVSAGDYDLVEPALARLGVTLEVTRVAVKPGAPLVVGHRGGTLVFGLPGNPVSAQVTFELFARPALLRMQGARVLLRPRLLARAAVAFTNRSGRESHVPVRLAFGAEGPRVWPLRSQGSGDLAAHARANALAVLTPERTAVAAGELLPVWLASGFMERDVEEA